MGTCLSYAYFDCPVAELSEHDDEQILGALVTQHHFELDLLQRGAWQQQITHLKRVLNGLNRGHLFLEYAIPRMGKRVDAVVLLGRTVVVLEYKVGASTYDRSAQNQVMDYALDLKNFHEGTHSLRVLPVLVATEAPSVGRESLAWYDDRVARPVLANRQSLRDVLTGVDTEVKEIDPLEWASSRYKPTPTIVEAAKALYAGHDVEEISRSDAGAKNLSATADAIAEHIRELKATGKKGICFVTGVPGSGKTLAGLNLATDGMRSRAAEFAVYLSGNGPLVLVLREALARDEVERAAASGTTMTKAEAKQRASTFIQNIHHFRDDALRGTSPPVEGVVIFDEAQRAWDRKQTSKFMRTKRGQAGFDMSEAEFMLSVMNRGESWAMVVCLIGNGQEIHTGEAGISEWFRAVGESHSDWMAWYSPRFTVNDADRAALQLLPSSAQVDESLHLGVSVRSFRAERLSDFVAEVLNGDAPEARRIAASLSDYPLAITRDLDKARAWLRRKARGTERYGLVASANALRLKPEGIHVKAKIATAQWFLDDASDVRSSFALEDAATEFDVQGLELDWIGVCWDANLRREEEEWTAYQFRGTKWQAVDGDRHRYLINAYRVLLTRARQGLVVFVPKGDTNDPPLDGTRSAEFYDGAYDFLVSCGFTEVLS